MDLNIIRQIQKISSNNDSYINSARDILRSVNNTISKGAVDENVLAKYIHSIEVLDKKAGDSMISLGSIYKSRIYDNYETSVESYFKNAIHISNTLPEQAPAQTILSFDVQYKNTGMFYSWNDAKTIKSRVRIYRTSGVPQLYDPLIKILDTSFPQNTPGDTGLEETGADYGRIKTFTLSTDNSLPIGEYLFTFSIINGDMVENNYDQAFVNSTYSQQITLI